jgi:hypothetical protein
MAVGRGVLTIVSSGVRFVLLVLLGQFSQPLQSSKLRDVNIRRAAVERARDFCTGQASHAELDHLPLMLRKLTQQRLNAPRVVAGQGQLFG